MWSFLKNSFMKRNKEKSFLKADGTVSENKAQDKNLLVFIEAALACLKEESFEKMSVTRIVDKSGLSRQTFYRCCSNKYDMVNKYFDRLLKETVDEAVLHRNFNLFPFFLAERISAKKELFQAAFGTDDYDGLTKYAHRQIFRIYLDYLKNRYGEIIDSYYEQLLDLYCSSFVQIIRQWSFGENLKDAGEVVDMIRDVIPAKLEILL